jgi:hypothetical protein
MTYAQAVRRPSRPELVLIVGSGIWMFAIFCALRNTLCDDAYITLAYAKNLAQDLHWGLVPQEVSNTATAPLNVLVLGAATALTRLGGGIHPILAMGAVSVSLAMLMAWAWTRIARALGVPLVAAVLGVALVLLNPFLLSAIGLESLLVATLLVLLLASALEARSIAFGVLAGLTLLARLDLVVFVLPVALATGPIRVRWRTALGIAAAVAAPWFVFSWFALGSAVPDTLLIKAAQTEWGYLVGPVTFFTDQQPNAVALSFLPAVGGVFALAVWLVMRTSVEWKAPLPPLGPAAALGVGGVAYYALYVALGVNPYHWYYIPPTAALSTFLAIALGTWLAQARSLPRLRVAAPTAALGLAGLLALGSLAVDLRQGLPWRSPVISGSWAMATDYARIARELRGRIGDARVGSPGEIGTLAFFCECAILDEYSDRGRAVELVNQRIARSGRLARLALRTNYLRLDRRRRPRPLDYQLRFDPGTGTRPPAGAVVWRVWSPLHGTRYLMLTRAPA